MTTLLQETVRTVKNWWLFLLYGIALIAMAIWMFSNPEQSYVALSIVFSIFVLVNGIFHIYFSYTNRNLIEGWGWYLAGGILELIIGIALISNPQLSMATLPFFIGFWLLFRAGFIIGSAFDLKKFGFSDWGWILFWGILLAAFAFIIIIRPSLGAFTAVFWTAFAFIFFGVSYIMFALKLRKLKKGVSKIKKNIKGAAEDFKKAFGARLEEIFKNAEEAQKARAAMNTEVDNMVKGLEKE